MLRRKVPRKTDVGRRLEDRIGPCMPLSRIIDAPSKVWGGGYLFILEERVDSQQDGATKLPVKGVENHPLDRHKEEGNPNQEQSRESSSWPKGGCAKKSRNSNG
jgi:hypothetical protein